MEINIQPEEWGLTRVLKRIQEIKTKFSPTPAQAQDFNSVLKNTIDTNTVKTTNNSVVQDELLDLSSQSSRINIQDDLLHDNDVETTSNFTSIIENKAQKYNIDKDLLNAVIKAESNYNANAVSPKGAKGLMQLMPLTAQDLDVADVFDPDQNIDGGAKYLKMLLNKYNDNTSMALAAYNAGSNAVDAYGAIPPYPETKNYVSRVLNILEKLKGQ